ncbi:MAG: DUF2065 family protein [Candidatus Marinimicrobia bacterium]|nr:DUF2065 family protein [Candidatus Neomarinimicrobiota bacterium]
MVLYYVIIGLIFLTIFIVSLLFPEFVKNLMKYIIKREFFIPIGIAEIILGLGILYFRHRTKLKIFILIIGLFLFIDGVMYLISGERVRKSYSRFLEEGDRIFRFYFLFIGIIGLGLILAGFY